MNDIEKSGAMVLAILACLLPNGVRQRSLKINDLNLPETIESDSLLFSSAMTWLKNEGIIMYRWSGMDFQFGSCALTSKGFAIMGQNFPGQLEKKSVGEAILEATEGKPNYSAWGEFSGGILGALMKTLSS
jgi:hypothetical protein